MYYCFLVSHLCRYTFGRSYSEKAEVSLFMKLLQEKDNALGQLTVSLEREAQKQSQLIFNMFYYTMCFITLCVLLHNMFYYTMLLFILAFLTNKVACLLVNGNNI